ncbi:alpha-glucosidase [Pseudothermotoga thermarum]|uniref:Glycoside hydrolase family 31 n=1 Tax=Pseudothermotoga thermarum DSM 5069 TaxID=688269 RepID=F7YXF1_9THEM|nr:alpha-glucosidase [Pseudothermotoga thermarum]AEH51804.1 glycoside hydrolase family 31 [Pseudothermotoga thermarum DSM 5069]
MIQIVEAFEASSNVKIKDFHGHCNISTKIWNKVKLAKDAIKKIKDSPLTISIEGSREANTLILKFKTNKKEAIFGGGEQYTHLNLEGRKFFVFVQEQGVGRGYNLISFLAWLKGVRGNWYSTYFPQPVFFSTAGYGLIVNTFALTKVDFTVPGEWTIEIYDRKAQVIFLEGTLSQMVEMFHKMYGSKPSIYDWIFGVWIASQGSVEAVQRVIQVCERHKIPLTALWCQDWCGKNPTKFGRQVYWNWSYDEKDYHNLPEYIEKWKEKGIHFLGYINPFLIKNGPLYKEAANRGYLVKTKNGDPYDIYVTTFPAGMIDLTNSQAYAWYKDLIKKNMLSIGMSGWMADFGEYLPVDAKLEKGSGMEYHNEYPVIWARLNKEAVEESGKDAVFFMRAGYLQSTLYTPIHWAGDQNVDWSKSDGLPSVIPAMISMSLCGSKLVHFDTGGYTSLFWLKRSPELFMRWAEIGAFSPIMRTHQTNRPYKNFQFDDPRVLNHFSRMARIHFALKDYLKTELEEAVKTNKPLVRHLALDNPDDNVCLKLKYQYLLGRYLLVAPVIKRGAKSWKVYLPKGEWIHLWSRRKFEQGWIEIESPLGYPPVFVKASYEKAEELLAKVRDIS